MPKTLYTWTVDELDYLKDCVNTVQVTKSVIWESVCGLVNSKFHNCRTASSCMARYKRLKIRERTSYESATWADDELRFLESRLKEYSSVLTFDRPTSGEMWEQITESVNSEFHNGRTAASCRAKHKRAVIRERTYHESTAIRETVCL